MTIALESEVVATRFDPSTRTCFYTIERDGKRWTVSVPIEHFDALIDPRDDGATRKRKSREHLSKLLLNHMNSKAPDPQ